MKTLKCIEGQVEDLAQKAYDLNESCSMMDVRCRLEVSDTCENGESKRNELIESIESMFEQLRELNACTTETYKALANSEESIIKNLKDIIL